MTDTPKPPEGYDSWIQYAIAMIDPTDMLCTGREDEPVIIGGDGKQLAAEELKQLRAAAAAYREAMAILKLAHPKCFKSERSGSDHWCDLCDWVKRERESGRWTP